MERFSLEQMATEIEAVYDVIESRRAGEGGGKTPFNLDRP